jgi:hypothetical protein
MQASKKPPVDQDANYWAKPQATYYAAMDRVISAAGKQPMIAGQGP